MEEAHYNNVRKVRHLLKMCISYEAGSEVSQDPTRSLRFALSL